MQTSQLGRSRSLLRGRWLLTQLSQRGDSACPLPACTLTPWERRMRRLSPSGSSLRGSSHDVTGPVSSTRHLRGACLGQLSATPLVEAEGGSSAARRGLPPAAAAPAPSGERSRPARWALPRAAVAVSFASRVWQGSRAAHGAQG